MSRGFAVMDTARHREIARKGGIAAHAQGVAHRWTSETAREAGKKGGLAISSRPGHMSAIGKLGGRASHRT